MTPCRSGRPGNRKGTVTPSAGDVTRHGTKPGKKRPTRRRAGPKGSCVTPYRIPVASLSNTKIVPSPQTNNSDPNYSDRNCQKIFLLKDRNVIRRYDRSDSGSLQGVQPDEVPSPAPNEPTGTGGMQGDGIGSADSVYPGAVRRAEATEQQGGGVVGRRDQSERSVHLSEQVSNSSVACEIPCSRSSSFKACLIRS